MQITIPILPLGSFLHGFTIPLGSFLHGFTKPLSFFQKRHARTSLKGQRLAAELQSFGKGHFLEIGYRPLPLRGGHITLPS